MTRQSFYGRIKYVRDFSERDKDGNVVVDGSKILGIMCSKDWFRIKNQEITMDEFYNANNRSWQMYLNDVNMFQYSLFAPAVCFATEAVNIPITSLSFNNTQSITLEAVGDEEGLDILVTPAEATGTITYTSSAEDVFTVDANPSNNRNCKVLAIGTGTATLTAKSGNVEATLSVTVK